MANEFIKGWRVVLASAVGVGCGLSAMPFYTLGVFAGPLEAEFGWSRGEIFLAIAFMLLGTLIAAPIIGYLADRFGVRRIVLVSLAALAVTLASLSFTTSEIWTFYLLWTVMALLSTGTTPITWTRAINGWFNKLRGLALGLALAGTGIAAAILPSYAIQLIEGFGWRNAYLLLGLTIAIIALPIVFFLFSEKQEKIQSANEMPILETGLSLSGAFRNYRFWLMAIAISFISFGASGLITNTIPLLTDMGYTIEMAASLAGLIGISVIAGRVIAGFLIDKFWAPVVAFCFLLLPAFSCIILTGSGGSIAMNAIAVALVGLAAGAEFDLIAYFVSRYFGMKNYSKIYSAQYIFFAVSSGLAPAVFGAVFDATGDYDPILYITCGFFASGATLFLFFGRYPNFSKEPQIAH